MEILHLSNGQQVTDRLSAHGLRHFISWAARAVEDGSEVAMCLDKHECTGRGVLTNMEWDSKFFGRPLARISLLSVGDRETGKQLVEWLETRAWAAGYAHLTARIPASEYMAAWSLESQRFELLDVGINLSLKRDSREFLPVPCNPRYAQAADLADVLKFGISLFRNSFFYRDNFFSKDEADSLHQQWITNLFHGLCDIIWVYDLDSRVVGFITCKIDQSSRIGDIALIGVDPDCSKRGIGRALLAQASAWFFGNGAESIAVRTQMTNRSALNLYFGSGFKVEASDLTFCKTRRIA